MGGKQQYGNGTAVLVVDDELTDREEIRATLEAAGFSVLEAGSYREALRVFERAGAELLITDISLPGNNGCELAAALLRLRRGLKVLFISGYTGAEIFKFYSIPYSDSHFLRKPFRGPVLLERVRRVLQSPQALPSFGGLIDTNRTDLTRDG